MSTDLDTTRIVRSWLEEGRTTLPDWVRDDVMDRLPSTPQRRSRWTAWRFTTMPTAAKTAVAAAAVIVIAVGALTFLQRPTGPGATPTQSPTTTPTPEVTPAPTASVEPISNLPITGPVPAGTYRVTSTNILVTVPSGWHINGSEGRDLRKNEGSAEVVLMFWRPDIGVRPDACGGSEGPSSTGPTADDLLAALRDQDSTDVSEPVDVTIGEIAAQHLVVSASEGIDPAACEETLLHVWSSPTANGNDFGVTDPSGLPVYVSETESGRVVFTMFNGPDATAEDLAERDAVMESMVIEK